MHRFDANEWYSLIVATIDSERELNVTKHKLILCSCINAVFVATNILMLHMHIVWSTILSQNKQC